MSSPREPVADRLARSTLVTIFLGVIAVFAFGSILLHAQNLILAFLMGLFLTILVHPAVRRLERWLPRWAALTTMTITVVVSMAAFSSLLSYAAYAVGQAMPTYADQINGHLAAAFDALAHLGFEIEWAELRDDSVAGWLAGQVGLAFQSGAELVAQLVIVVFLMVFMVSESRVVHEKLRAVVPDEVGERIMNAAQRMVGAVQRYVVVKTGISLATGTLTWVICEAIGLDLAIVWGITAFLLNYIPNLGSVVAVIPPTLLAALQYESLGMALLTVVSLGALQMLVGYLIEPRIMGRSMQLSPLVVFLALILWGWLWGVIGALMAVPLTVGIKFMCAEFEATRPIATWLDLAPSQAEKQQERQSVMDDVVERASGERPAV